jgi:hypothetical protein
MKSENKLQRMSVYFPLDLLEQVRESARMHKRSFNKQVLWLVEQALRQEQKGQSRRDEQEEDAHLPVRTTASC